MSCTVEQREQARATAAALESLPVVVETDVLAPAQSQHDAWTVETTVDGSAVPPSVTHEVVLKGLAIESVGPQGAFCRLVCTV